MRRPLVLNGFMASGKSTLGRLVAERAGRAFIDLDRLIEAKTGLGVSEIFAQLGESAFRRVEADALSEVLGAGRADVVAVGGGALLARSARLVAMDRAVVVTLEADLEETLRRSGAQPGQRPLLHGDDARQRAERLLEQRALAYAECHARLDTSGRSPAQLAEELEAIWRRDGIGV